MRDDLERTAYHEVGHAVTAFLLRRRFKKVTIIPETGSLGHVSYAPLGAQFCEDVECFSFVSEDCGCFRLRGKIEREIIHTLGGIAAVAIHTPGSEYEGADSDLHQAYELAEWASRSPEESEAYIQWLRLRTEGMLRFAPYWEYVQAIVGALLERKTLSYHQVHGIIKSIQQARWDKGAEIARSPIDSGAIKVIRG